ncbi:MAG: hypothetical protein IPG00_02800 [Saprospiraceae bacterium]|nr:hypothetical protein [Saprospiraceae bacterium]
MNYQGYDGCIIKPLCTFEFDEFFFLIPLKDKVKGAAKAQLESTSSSFEHPLSPHSIVILPSSFIIFSVLIIVLGLIQHYIFQRGLKISMCPYEHKATAKMRKHFAQICKYEVQKEREKVFPESLGKHKVELIEWQTDHRIPCCIEA